MSVRAQTSFFFLIDIYSFVWKLPIDGWGLLRY